MLAYVKSDIGMVRKTNEDNFIFLPPHLFVVADGMGGHAAGEIASKIAVDTVKEYLTSLHTDENPQELLKQSIIKANEAILKMAQQNNACSGMGTTFSALYIKENIAFWGHVGDSRIYQVRHNEIEQITADHSLVWDLVRNGNITEEEAHTHPHRNILTRAVGTNEQIEIDTGTIHLESGDIFLLCTDGLTNMISNHDILKVLQNNIENTSTVLDTLIQQANQAGGLDNITAILVHDGDM